jgi:hypothetical protein
MKLNQKVQQVTEYLLIVIAVRHMTFVKQDIFCVDRALC